MRSSRCDSLPVFLVVLGVAYPGFAQTPTGPATLESPVNSGDSRSSTASATEATASDTKRPTGTVSRPKDGVRHPALDKAWAEYDAVIDKAAEQIRAAISKQFGVATAKGDLEAADKWQTTLEKFETSGEVPAETGTKIAVSEAVADCKRAKERLGMAYEAAIKALTKEKKIAEAKVVRAEQDSVLSIPVAPRPKVVFDDALVGTWLDGLPDGVTRTVFPNLEVQEVATKNRQNLATGKARRLADGRYEVRLSNGFATYYRLLSPNEVEFQAIDPRGKAQARVVLEKR